LRLGSYNIPGGEKLSGSEGKKAGGTGGTREPWEKRGIWVAERREGNGNLGGDGQFVSEGDRLQAGHTVGDLGG